MTQIEGMGKIIGSRRYARDRLDSGRRVYTRIWWDVPDPNEGRTDPERKRVIPAHQSK